jgi:hypothetical protein
MPSVKYGNKTSILIKNIAFISYVNGCGPPFLVFFKHGASNLKLRFTFYLANGWSINLQAIEN